MKNFLSSLKNKVNALAVRVHSAAVCTQSAVTNDAGDFISPTGCGSSSPWCSARFCWRL